MRFDRTISLQDLHDLTTDVPGQIRLRATFASDYEAFAAAVEDAIEWIVGEMQRNPQAKRCLGEDQLTLEIITNLRAMSFNAHHDAMIGGHGDIVVEGKNAYLWIGEAKIHTSYDWILAGFDQLSTRYSTGAVMESRGGLIIYVKIAGTKSVLDAWKERLRESRGGVSIYDCPKNPLAFSSIHYHQRTGLDFKVRHLAVALYYDAAPKPPPKRPRKSSAKQGKSSENAERQTRAALARDQDIARNVAR